MKCFCIKKEGEVSPRTRVFSTHFLALHKHFIHTQKTRVTHTNLTSRKEDLHNFFLSPHYFFSTSLPLCVYMWDVIIIGVIWITIFPCDLNKNHWYYMQQRGGGPLVNLFKMFVYAVPFWSPEHSAACRDKKCSFSPMTIGLLWCHTYILKLIPSFLKALKFLSAHCILPLTREAISVTLSYQHRPTAELLLPQRVNTILWWWEIIFPFEEAPF